MLEPAVAGLVRRVPLRHVLPGRASAQHPEDAVEHLAGIPPGPAAPIGAASELRHQRFDQRPLLVGQVHIEEIGIPPTSPKYL